MLQGLPVDSFVREFKYKQFARNFVALNGDVEGAFRKTFGDMDSARATILRRADAILMRPEVEMEINSLLPTDQELNRVIANAIAAPTDPLISWADKHKYVATALELRGRIRQKEGVGGNTTNVVMFVEHGSRIQEPGDGTRVAEVDAQPVAGEILDK